MIFFIGIDISANHGALVFVDSSGIPSAWWGFSHKAADGRLAGYDRLDIPKTKDKQQAALNRLCAVGDWIDCHAVLLDKPTAISLEDYGYSPKAGAASIAQVGGLIRYAIMKESRQPRLRLHPPGTINLYTGTPAGDKAATREAVLAMHPEAAALPADSEGDMIDAFVLARILNLEMDVRAGRVKLEDLTEGQRRIFLRTTQAFPENLLCRPLLG